LQVVKRHKSHLERIQMLLSVYSEASIQDWLPSLEENLALLKQRSQDLDSFVGDLQSCQCIDDTYQVP